VARLVDTDALLLDLRGALQERASWGRAQVLDLINELEQRHRISESDDAAVLRRFSEHLTDTFLGIVPTPHATTDPLDGGDPSGAQAPMAGGATPDQAPTEGSTRCLTSRHGPPPDPPIPAPALSKADGSLAASPRRVPATI